GKLKFKVVMSMPVLQGYACRSKTRFVLLPPQNNEYSDNNPGGYTSSGTSTPASDGLSVDGDIEIDETFLAGTITSFLDGQGPVQERNGPSPRHPHRFVAEPLLCVVHPSLDDHTVYVRTSDLSRLGILDSDWALLRLEASQSRRAVRVRAYDAVVPKPGVLLASPILLHNVCSRIAQQYPVFELQALPDVLRGRALPVSQSVTVARVASQIAINRIYQPLVLQALKSFFGTGKRLIRQGDFIAVKIDIMQYQLVASFTDESSPEISADELAPFESGDELVYFLVTNVDCNPLRTDSAITQPADLSVAIALGELGCWVDASETRVTQAGVEHALVPDASVYLGKPSDLCLRSPWLYGVSSGLDGLRMLSGNVRNNEAAYGRIRDLLSAALVPHALSYGIPISVLLKGSRGVGKATIVQDVAKELGMQTFKFDCFELLGDTDAKTEGVLRARFDQVTSCSPCILILRNVDALVQSTQSPEPGNEPMVANVLKDLLYDVSGSCRLSGYPILVFGTTSEPGRLPPSLLACFKHEVEFHAPDENERAAILRSLLSQRVVAPDVDPAFLAKKTAAFVAGDIVALVSRANMKAIARATYLLRSNAPDNHHNTEDIMYAGIALTESDFEAALEEARSSYSRSIGAPTIPSVSWDDVGGLADVKADILDTIQLPLEHPELFSQDLKKRSGILLYGPPGTGKTLLAKAVATSFSLNFFSVKGPELLNMYIGESEANVRRVFQRARDARPCVVFFDELDSVAPKRGAHGDSGGVMDRIVSQLLAELDGIAAGSGGDVFVIGATNRPDLLDSALLRPGRFDRMLYLGVSNTNTAQLKILQALTRKLRLDPGLDLMTVVKKCPFNFTGADFYALCTDALLKAMTRKAEEVDAKIGELERAMLNNDSAPSNHPTPITPQYFLAEMAAPNDVLVTILKRDFDRALDELTPSVSQAEMEHYEQIQRRFMRKSEE
ncbi:AAA-domain-containing protein, partial [Vararia minispora EC-137]